MARRSTYASLSRPRLPFRPMPAPPPGTAACGRCNGTGGFRSHKAIHGGECFSCAGLGYLPAGVRSFGHPMLTVERLRGEEWQWQMIAAGTRNGVQDALADVARLGRDGFDVGGALRVVVGGVVVWTGSLDRYGAVEREAA